MKKFIIALLASVMLLTGCGTTYSYETEVYMDKFVNVETRESMVDGCNMSLHIVYDYDTKVMYYLWIGYEKFSFNPVYNADGSVMVYEGEER